MPLPWWLCVRLREQCVSSFAMAFFWVVFKQSEGCIECSWGTEVQHGIVAGRPRPERVTGP